MILFCRHSSCLFKSFVLRFSLLFSAFYDCSIIFLTYSLEQFLNLLTSSLIFDREASCGERTWLALPGDLLSIMVSVAGLASSRVIFLWKCCARRGSNWI
jgi:hypothetical protein